MFMYSPPPLELRETARPAQVSVGPDIELVYSRPPLEVPAPAAAGGGSMAPKTELTEASMPPAARVALQNLHLISESGIVDVEGLVNALELSRTVHAGQGIPISAFPEQHRDAIRNFDADGNGILDILETITAYEALHEQKQSRLDGKIPFGHFPEHIKEQLKDFDDDGDGKVDAREIIKGMEALVRAKRRNRELMLISTVFCLLMVLFCGLTVGLLVMVIDNYKDSAVSGGNVMTSRSTKEPVQIASNEMTIRNGLLVPRENTTSNCTRDQCPIPMQPLQTTQFSVAQNLSSWVDDAYLAELRVMTITQKDAVIHFQVLAVARYPEEGSRSGSVVVIYTFLGEITLDGTAIFFHEILQGAFKRAGLNVDANGRRLLGISQVIGLFSKINKAAASSAEADAVPNTIPLYFAAEMTITRSCGTKDCMYNGAPVDWVTSQPDGSQALVERERMYSLTFGGVPFGMSSTSKDQWPQQSLINIQNLTHSITFQSFRGRNYYCELKADDSLQKALEMRRKALEMRRQGSSPPLIYAGMATVNGVYCKHFRIPLDESESSGQFFDYYESFRTKLPYQLRFSALTWTYESMQPLTNESHKLLTFDDVNIDSIVANCDPLGRIPPPKLIDGLLSNRLIPEPHDGALISEIYNQTPSNISIVNTSLYRRAYRLNSHMVLEIPERPLEFTQQRRSDCSEQTMNRQFPPFDFPLPPVKKGELFTLVQRKENDCNSVTGYTTTITTSGAGSCPSKSGQINLFVPSSGKVSGMYFGGQLKFTFSINKCFLSSLSTSLQDAINKIATIDASLVIGARLKVMDETCASGNSLGRYIAPELYGIGSIDVTALRTVRISAQLSASILLAFLCASYMSPEQDTRLGLQLKISFRYQFCPGGWCWGKEIPEELTVLPFGDCGAQPLGYNYLSDSDAYALLDIGLPCLKLKVYERSPDDIVGPFLIRNPTKPNLCIDDSAATAPGTPLQMFQCDVFNPNQQFVLMPNNNNGLYFKNPNKNNLCIDDGATTCFGSGCPLMQTWTCDVNNINQKFQYDPSTRLIRNPNKNNLCLDDSSARGNGAHPWSWVCDPAQRNQMWVFIPVYPKPSDIQGRFLIKNPMKNNLCIDDNAATASGTPLHMWNCDPGNANQQFTYVLLGTDGSVQLTNPNKNNLCIDDGAATTLGPNTPVFQTFTCDKSNRNQRFIYDPATRLLRNPNKNNLCLDDNNADGPGPTPWSWRCDSAQRNQMWVFVPI